ncbi:TetR/AcrR family transcriptional regulator [Myxococcus sp. K15C18031901]|uniref:TetR/AcrR family transcriptional regulator n=1 Tax=Myxococcus dinghuensis TaxID=2906761 RepID=UPI0020A7E407|nr:TetR/AcrR family transcriptional regulator [Myxococcus dinghuensis]MCP3098246.1 TetR/AcrR family transcriptional regulator [Myxococcus dinghuensis]
MSSDPRIAILEAAGEIFARFGFKKASIEDIARKAGVGKGSIYLHFESKEALFEAIVLRSHEQGISELKTRVQQATTSEEKLRAYIRCKFEQQARKPGGHTIELSHLFDLGVQAMKAKDLVPRMRAAETAVLEGIIEEGVAQGVFMTASPALTAQGLQELISVPTLRMMVEEPDARFHQSLETCFDLFIRGLKARPPPTT